MIEKFEKKESIENLKEILRLKKELIEKDRLIERLKEDLIHDDLTGLKTKKFFNEILKITIDEIERGIKEKASLLFCDIDNFKKINDEKGHLIGDEILKDVAKILLESTREEDVVSRWGGEEIAILLNGADEERAKIKAKFLKEKIKRILFEKYGFLITVSFGVKEIEPKMEIQELMECVDKAMYQSKTKGKDEVTAFSEIKDQITL